MQNVIKQVWETQMEILDVIDKVCSANGLRYCLAYGTLLGAVRHGGFIPWDDDIDLMMPREDYEKLLQIWQDQAPEGYLLQNKRRDPDFTQNFTKIRKDHTTFLQEDWERTRAYHKGIFVDIFPGDRVAPQGIQRRIQFCFDRLNLLYSRGFPAKTDGLDGMVQRLLLRIPEKYHSPLQQKAERLAGHWNQNSGRPLYFPSTLGAASIYYPADTFENLEWIPFQGKSYPAPGNRNQILKLEYGDYMRLPPPEERVWKHHPLVVDFARNYEELNDEG